MNYGGDIPEYKQTQICEKVCRQFGSTEVFNTHCQDYLRCSCIMNIKQGGNDNE